MIVGAGPGGCLLSYLLARSGIGTVLIERHATLDREFRGYLFQPRALDIFEQYGLLQGVLELPHDLVRRPEVVVYGRPCPTIDFEALGGVLPTALMGFEDCTLLRTEPGISERWVDGGLLLLGDAAHIASPVGGQGNALALADAVVAHEVIARALSLDPGEGPLVPCTLGRYETRRRPAVEEIVRTQRRAERALTALVLYGGRVPRPIRRPLLRALFSLAPHTPGAKRTVELFAFGVEPIRVDDSWFDREIPTHF